MKFSNGARKLSKLIATVFFVGYIPLAPGTAASLAGLGLYLLIRNNSILYIFVTVSVLILGFWSSSLCEKDFRKKDPHQIVIDEFSCMLLVYAFIPFSPALLSIGFILFRFFDIFKIPPIKKLEKLPRGYGIMFDDIAAAVLTNLILQALRFFPQLI